MVVKYKMPTKASWEAHAVNKLRKAREIDNKANSYVKEFGSIEHTDLSGDQTGKATRDLNKFSQLMSRDWSKKTPAEQEAELKAKVKQMDDNQLINFMKHGNVPSEAPKPSGGFSGISQKAMDNLKMPGAYTKSPEKSRSTGFLALFAGMIFGGRSRPKGSGP